jgi:pyrroloquinoline quinone biosynthesis protein B
VAISYDGSCWFLLNASPDLRAQIEANSFLNPRDGLRQSPIAGVVLTSADLDQVLGLLLLRELQPLHIFATESVRQVVRDDNRMFAMLQRVPKQAQWTEITPNTSFPLAPISGEDSATRASSIRCLPVPLQPRFPSYVSPERAAGLRPQEALIGLIVEHSYKSGAGGKLAYFPVVPAIDNSLLKQLEALQSEDVLLFDGTFWSDDELIKIEAKSQTARQMGHVPVSSSAGSLQLLAGLRGPRKIFVHVNNTNPMLDESGPEYGQVRDAGWEVAEDGWHFEL